jgi:hypothetical protein
MGLQQCVGLLFKENAHHQLWLFSFVRSTERFHMPYQGVSHAEWPKDKHEYAPTRTGSTICWLLKAVVIECRPPRTERLSQRATKL